MITQEEASSSAAVLLVDDMPANLLALEAALSPLKVRTVTARSGLDALRWVERQPFAVALVDVQMPGMDGFELTARLRQTKHGRELPIMFVTAVHNDESYVRRGYATGAADYITKPYDALIVRARVKAFVDLYEQREAVRRGQLALRTQERDQAIRRLVAFERIASAALETNDLNALLQELLQAFIHAADAADSATILLRDGDLLKVAASIGTAQPGKDEVRVRIGRGFAGLVASERRSLEISEDAIKRMVETPLLKENEPRALYGVPLLHDGQLVGVAHIGSKSAVKFSQEEKKVFAAAAERAALAVAKQQQASLLSEILDIAPAYVAIVSVDSLEYTFVNPPLRDLVGGALVGSVLGERGLGAEARFAVERARQVGAPTVVDELPIMTGGGQRYLQLNVQPLRDSSGLIERFLLFASDVTAQVSARRQLELAEAERIELLQRERRARAAAEAASTAKDEFLATVSHELRTPLTAILGWASLARSRPNADINRALSVIERNARAQARIVEDLLDYSRMSKGKMRLAMQRVDVSDIVRVALESVRPAAEAKGISINVRLPSPCVLSADAGRLQQVIWNLLANAVKYTANGGTVDVHGQCEQGEATITVSDSGQGIEPEFLPHVFEAFRQANSSTTRRHGGLGLGLAIVRQIVDAHGGDIRAASGGLGKGSSFTVRLPLDGVESADAAVEVRSPSIPPPDLGLRLDGLKVLVVDDDDDGRELIAQVLSAHGAEVSMLPSAQLALTELERFRPDVLVSDIAMPELDGYELIRRVRQLDEARGGLTPALAVTAHAGKEVIERVLQSGFQRYASKPLDVIGLIAHVSDLARWGREGGTEPPLYATS